MSEMTEMMDVFFNGRPARASAETVRVRLACHKCGQWIILKLAVSSHLHSFECKCGHESIIKRIPVVNAGDQTK
jgi:hypothetical protein